MVRLIVTERDALRADVSVADEAVYIGSRPGCKIYLNDLRVGKQHCVIFPEREGCWVLEHLDEKKYTRVNGLVVSDRHELRDGDEITIQEYAIRVHLESRPYEPPAPTVQEMARITHFPLPPGSIVRKPEDVVHLTRAQLDQLRRIGLSFNKISSLAELMDLALMTLLQVFKGRQAWMCITGSTAPASLAEGRNMAGHPIEPPPLAEKLRYRCTDRSQHVCIPSVGDGQTGSAMAVPLIGPEGKLGLIYVDNRPTSPPYTQQDLDFLGLLAAVVGVHIEATVHKQARLRAEVSYGELNVARKVRTQLLPSAHPEWENLRMVRLAEDGERGVRDFYDAIKLPDKSAALILARAEAPLDRSLQMLAQVRAAFRVGSLHADPSHVILRALNWLLYEPAEHNALHVCVANVNPTTGDVHYATAGEPGLVIVDDRGTPRELPLCKAPPAGTVRNFDFTTQRDHLHTGQMLALFTDGVTALTNAQGVPLGRTRFVEMLADVFGQPVVPAMNELMTDLHDYMKDGHRPHDVTILLLAREA